MKRTLATLLLVAVAILVLDIAISRYEGGRPQSTNWFQKTMSSIGLGSIEGMKNKQGVCKDEIPEGEEDLYILKSEIVPPVCPACPPVTVCPKEQAKKCPPCPPCGRCPSPAFECKKVPNYNAPQNAMLPGFYGNAGIAGASAPIGGDASSSQPMPVLNDFSQFGM